MQVLIHPLLQIIRVSFRFVMGLPLFVLGLDGVLPNPVVNESLCVWNTCLDRGLLLTDGVVSGLTCWRSRPHWAAVHPAS